MDRSYTGVIKEHLAKYRQMVFLSGPRQVGKTTCSKFLVDDSHYLNWEDTTHRKLIIKGSQAIAEHLGLNKGRAKLPLIVFDEIHKYSKWKLFLKGFFDLYEDRCRILVTGSAKLTVYQKGGDSLMGRYFPYRMHPLSVAELLKRRPDEKEYQTAKKLKQTEIDRLLEFGGFPEPFVKADRRFSKNWQKLRKQQLLREDIRQLSQIQDFAPLEILMDLLIEEAGQLLNASSIANQINVAESTIARWIKTLSAFYFCFLIKPWSKNVRRSLRKTPKVYLWDWSMVNDVGQRAENFVASHLHKAVQYWSDLGMGDYDLFYLRDKNKNEVDFLVVRNKVPWILIEVKQSANKGFSKGFHHFYKELKPEHALQVVYDLPYEQIDCFSYQKPVIVPLSTFLSQLV